MKRIEIVVLIALIVASCSQQEISEVDIMSAEIRNNISILQSHKIFFGHQSVGRNIMNGIKDILAQYPEYRVNLVAAIRYRPIALNLILPMLTSVKMYNPSSNAMILKTSY